jgi:hypothetical protein
MHKSKKKLEIKLKIRSSKIKGQSRIGFKLTLDRENDAGGDCHGQEDHNKE